MLTELKIKDFAIIDVLSIRFTDGMNIFTGETGAGKSIIIDAVNLVLGGRGSPDYVRTGCKEARIEALFDIAGDSALQTALDDLGLDRSDQLIIKRVLSSAGKSKVMINDSFTTLSALNGLAPMLINIYGQNEHQELLVKDRHLEMLDSFGNITHLVDQYKKSFTSLREVEERLKGLIKAAENRDKEIGFIRFQLSEIKAANLKKGEEEELKRESNLLANAEKILSTCASGFEQLYSKEGSISTLLSDILAGLEKVKTLDSSFENYHSEIQNALYSLEDTAFFFRDYPKKIDFSPSSLDEVESRLEAINVIKKKYGSTVEKVFETKAELEERLNELTDLSENLELLESKKTELHEKALTLAKKLSARRLEASERLRDKMSEELKSLGMVNAGFIVKFDEPSDEVRLGETGADEAEFYFSANPGESFKPLLKVASGGELSRIMLALKNVTKGSSDSPSTLIFDEVDAGIGGKTAHIVGAKLRALSNVNQVVCITHLSQIASYADSYYHVVKVKQSGRMVTKVKELDQKERVNEVARLLSGEHITPHSIKHASDMISKNQRGALN